MAGNLLVVITVRFSESNKERYPMSTDANETSEQPLVPRPICDFFIDRDDVEYIVEVYTAYDGYAEDYGVYVLLEDGTKGNSVDVEPFNDEVQSRYWSHLNSLDDDGRDSYPASHY